MSSNVTKVAKNAAALYLRSAVSLLIQLIAVRYLLKYLGADSYGLYGLVGSIVWIAESLRGIFSSSLQRFLNIEAGKGNTENLNDIFNVGLRLIAVMASGAIILLIVGGFIVIPYLNIPPDLKFAAKMVLILSSITLGVHLLTTVLDAVIIAHEQFNFLAYVSIAHSVLKLASVLVLVLFPNARVEWYSLFILIAGFAVLVTNYIYCKTKYCQIIKPAHVQNKSYYKEIGSFTAYKSLGSSITSAQTAGVNILLNVFGSLVVNTARTIAYQIINAVNILVWNLITGFTPRCIQLYGEGNYQEFNRLLFMMMKSTLLLNTILGFVLTMFMQPLLMIWLGEIPEYTESFIPIIFLYFIIRAIQDGLDLLFTASGKIREFQISIAITQTLSIVLGAIALWCGLPYYSVFTSMVITECLCILYGLWFAKRTCGFNVRYFWQKIGMPLIFLLATLCGVIILSYGFISSVENLSILFVLFLLAFAMSAGMGFMLLFGKGSATVIINEIKGRIH